MSNVEQGMSNDEGAWVVSGIRFEGVDSAGTALCLVAAYVREIAQRSDPNA